MPRLRDTFLRHRDRTKKLCASLHTVLPCIRNWALYSHFGAGNHAIVKTTQQLLYWHFWLFPRAVHYTAPASIDYIHGNRMIHLIGSTTMFN